MTRMALLMLATLMAVRTTEGTVFVLRSTFMGGMSAGAKPYSNRN
ncbi:hypothetical protein MAXJ12_18258 [Mesorhizobium alhagi CCNWXJ12-2]|jgi:hypothetical protein|uniref:Uncharacterized protein n=1 Tax=Mesorhizobium alhagi CCNWXJ12-2 TaxID=1107882 RepID=H0HU10_9HYPH|nr:hypothetical protein MAXJ12_18258 [Mesorhizobium alhagi CCNWXJ12-2]